MKTQVFQQWQLLNWRGRRWAVSLLVTCLLLLGFETVTGVVPGELWVLYRAKVPLYQAICDSLSRFEVQVIPCPLESLSNAYLESHPPKIMIALGDAAVQRALKTNWDVPIIGLFAETAVTDARFRAFEVKIPLDRQLSLLRRLCPQTHRLVVPYTTRGVFNHEELRLAATASNLQYHEAYLPEPRFWAEFFGKLSDGNSAVWLPVDPRLINQAFLENLLVESFRHHIPVIGFSESQVRQGALFAFTINPDKIARAILNYANELVILGKQVPTSGVFSDWELVVNATVASKFGLVIPRDLLEMAHRLF